MKMMQELRRRMLDGQMEDDGLKNRWRKRRKWKRFSLESLKSKQMEKKLTVKSNLTLQEYFPITASLTNITWNGILQIINIIT